MSKLRRTLKNKFDEKADSPVIYSGKLGDGLGTVNAGNGKVYVRISNTVNTALCSGIPYINNLDVWVGYTAEMPTVLRVLGQQPNQSSVYFDGIGKHAKQHEWMGQGVGGGTDVLSVHLQQFLPLMVFPYGEYQVGVYPGIAWINGEYKLIADINSHGKPVPKVIDLREFAPAVGKEFYTLIGVNTSGEIEIIQGTEVNKQTMALSDIPEASETMQIKLAAVRRYADQLSIVVNRETVDIVDLRFPMWEAIGSNNIFDVDWDKITFTGSDLADLETKSHTALSDKGTNTHSTIDAFINSHSHAQSDITDRSFLGLLDTPSTYTGQLGKYVKVALDGLEFAEVSGGGGGGGGGSTGDQTWYIAGALVPLTDAGGVFICPRDATIQAVYIYCEDTGSADSTIVDVNLNGTTIFTEQSNRPELAYDDADKLAKSGSPDITLLSEGDILSIDIDAAATDAEDLTVLVAMDVTIGAVGSLSAIFTQTGLLSIGTRNQKITNLTGRVLTITKVHVVVGTPPTGSSIIIDVNKNGTTIFTDQGNRPAILATEYSGYTITIDEDSWGVDQYLNIDFDQVGSSGAGRDLVVTIVCK